MPASRAAALLLLIAGAPALAQMSPPEAPTEGASQFTPPVLVKRASAAYPKEALEKNLSGTVVLEFDVDDKGVVRNVTVQTPAGHGFDSAAAAAVKQFVFRPALHDGVPVTSHVTYAYKFVLKLAPKPPKKAHDETVRLKGGVYLRGTRAPVTGGKVIAVPRGNTKTSYSARIGEDGQFAIKGIPPGRYHVVVNGPKADRFETNETIGKDQVVTVHYFIQPSQYTRYESTVHGDLDREEISRQTLTTEELVKMPGSMGDALRAVENLPGVARAPFNSGLLIVRGGKPTDSKVFLGASEVPQLYHFGGFTSIVPTQAIESVDFLPGNFSVRYGRAIAGVIDVELREGKRDRWHGAAETNLFDTGLMAEGPVGKGSLLLAARRSYIDAILSAVAPPGLKFTDAPVYYDYQGVLDYPLAGGKLKAMVLGSDDVLKLVFDRPADSDPSLTAFGTHIFFHKGQLRYTRAIGKWNLFAQLAGGYSGQEGALGNNLRYDVGIGQIDARVEGRYFWSKKLRLLVGTDVTYSNVSLNLDVPPPPHEGQIPSPISANAIEHHHGVQNYGLIGLYLEAHWKPTDKLTITPGLRFDWYSALHHPSFDPRLTASWQVARFTTLKAGVGLFSQSPQSTDFDPQFGNPALRPEEALHTTLTVEQGVAPGVMLSLTGFYKHLWDLSTPTNNFLFVNQTTTPERFASIGEGRIYGMEVMLRQAISKWLFGWVSYTLMKSERKDCDACNWRLFDYDQTHVLIVALHAYLPKGWELGARFRYITGLPYTPAYGGFYDADSDVYSPANGPVNTGRLADFHSLDLRVDKTFLFKRWVLKLYLDVTNVYDRSNEEVNQPAFDFSRRAAITGLPIIPSFGIRGEF